MKELIKPDNNYQGLITQISETYRQGQQSATIAVNSHLVNTYWKIGQDIVEFEQEGKLRAEYGKALLKNISKDLTLEHGKGFSLSNVKRMRQFYLVYQKGAKPSHLLSWSHYVEFLKISDKLERSFYLQQTINENWSIPELKRQKKSSLYLRLAASKDKEGILELSKKGQIIQQPSDIIREPCTLEFLKIPEPYHLTETELSNPKIKFHVSRI